MKARWATLWDMPQAIGFAIANAVKGNLDFRIYRYPSTRIACAEDDEGMALVYLPVHSGMILESLGWAPELSVEGKILAGITAIEQVEKEAWALGIREVFFVSSDERTDQFCEERLGYERVSCMRKRL